MTRAWGHPFGVSGKRRLHYPGFRLLASLTLHPGLTWGHPCGVWAHAAPWADLGPPCGVVGTCPTQGFAALHPGLIWGHPFGVFGPGSLTLHPGLIWGHPCGVFRKLTLHPGLIWGRPFRDCSLGTLNSVTRRENSRPSRPVLTQRESRRCVATGFASGVRLSPWWPGVGRRRRCWS